MSDPFHDQPDSALTHVEQQRLEQVERARTRELPGYADDPLEARDLVDNTPNQVLPELRGRSAWDLREELDTLHRSTAWRRGYHIDHAAAMKRDSDLTLALIIAERQTPERQSRYAPRAGSAEPRPSAAPARSIISVPDFWNGDTEAADRDLVHLEALEERLGVPGAVAHVLSALNKQPSYAPPPERGTSEEEEQANHAFEELAARYGEDEAYQLTEDGYRLLQLVPENVREALWKSARGHSANVTVALARAWRSRRRHDHERHESARECRGARGRGGRPAAAASHGGAASRRP